MLRSSSGRVLARIPGTLADTDGTSEYWKKQFVVVTLQTDGIRCEGKLLGCTELTSNLEEVEHINLSVSQNR